jgi:hypothetical protein
LDLSVEWLFGAGVLRISTENFNGTWTQNGFLNDIEHGSGGFSRTIMFPNKDFTLTKGPGTCTEGYWFTVEFSKVLERKNGFLRDIQKDIWIRCRNKITNPRFIDIEQ